MLSPGLCNYYFSSLKHTSILLQINFSSSNVSGTVPDTLRKFLVPFSAFLHALWSITIMPHLQSWTEPDCPSVFPTDSWLLQAGVTSAQHLIEYWAPSTHRKVNGFVHWKSRPLLKGQRRIGNHTGLWNQKGLSSLAKTLPHTCCVMLDKCPVCLCQFLHLLHGVRHTKFCTVLL